MERFSKNPNGGHITASSTEGTGYLMYNCKVTKNRALSIKIGNFGRPWRATIQVFYFNTTLEDITTINAAGWGSMGGVQPEEVEGFKKYGQNMQMVAQSLLQEEKGMYLLIKM